MPRDTIRIMKSKKKSGGRRRGRGRGFLVFYIIQSLEILKKIAINMLKISNLALFKV